VAFDFRWWWFGISCIFSNMRDFQFKEVTSHKTHLFVEMIEKLIIFFILNAAPVMCTGNNLGGLSSSEDGSGGVSK